MGRKETEEAMEQARSGVGMKHSSVEGLIDDLNSDDDDFLQSIKADPDGYIECDGELMAFWLPEGVSADDLELEWYEP